MKQFDAISVPLKSSLNQNTKCLEAAEDFAERCLSVWGNISHTGLERVSYTLREDMSIPMENRFMEETGTLIQFKTAGNPDLRIVVEVGVIQGGECRAWAVRALGYEASLPRDNYGPIIGNPDDHMLCLEFARNVEKYLINSRGNL